MQVIEKRRECVEEKLVAEPVNKELVQAFLAKLEQEDNGAAGTKFMVAEFVDSYEAPVTGWQEYFFPEENKKRPSSSKKLSVYSYGNDVEEPTIFCVDKERGLTALDAAAEDYTYLEQVMYEILINENTFMMTLCPDQEPERTAKESAEEVHFQDVKIFTTQYASLGALN